MQNFLNIKIYNQIPWIMGIKFKMILTKNYKGFTKNNLNFIAFKLSHGA